MPPITEPVCTPMRQPTSTARAAATSATTCCIASAKRTARSAALSTDSVLLNAPQHATYASPIVLTLWTPCVLASSSKLSNISERIPSTSAGECDAESGVKPTMSACTTVTSS
eukprot:3189694-Prymnesium_polylepis.1